MKKGQESEKNENSESSVVTFEKVNDNVGKVIAVRNGETFSIELYSLTDDDISEIKKIREEITKERMHL